MCLPVAYWWCRTKLLDLAVRSREDAAVFDTSRLADFNEHLLWEGPAVQLSPLIREPGRLAVTDQRVYFQPLHNVAGMVEESKHVKVATVECLHHPRRCTCAA